MEGSAVNNKAICRISLTEECISSREQCGLNTGKWQQVWVPLYIIMRHYIWGKRVISLSKDRSTITKNGRWEKGHGAKFHWFSKTWVCSHYTIWNTDNSEIFLIEKASQTIFDLSQQGYHFLYFYSLFLMEAANGVFRKARLRATRNIPHTSRVLFTYSCPHAHTKNMFILFFVPVLIDSVTSEQI